MSAGHSIILREHVDWSRSLFERLAEGGVWAVPRSGLLFQKRDGGLTLLERMPWASELPLTREELREQQESDIRAITRHFAATGIEVRVS